MVSYVNRRTLDDRTYILNELSNIRLGSASPHEPIMSKLRRVVPFENYAFTGLDIEGFEVGKGIYLASDMPEGFRATYTRERFVEADPLVRVISPSLPIGQWNEIDDGNWNDIRVRQFCTALNSYEIAPRAGITFWNGERMYGGAVFTRRRPFTQDELFLLNLFAEALHTQLSKPLIAAVNSRIA